MTFCPLKSAREILPPPFVATENWGATSPAFSFNSIALAINFSSRTNTDKHGCKLLFHLRSSAFIRSSFFCRRQTGRMRAELLRAVPNIEQAGGAGEQSRAQADDLEPRRVGVRPLQQNPQHH